MNKIKLTPSRLDWTFEIAAALALLIAFVVLAIQFGDLPDRVPIHFDATGTPDGFGSKSTLISLPLIALFLYGLLTIVNRYPHVFNYTVPITDENRERQYRNAVLMLRVVKAVISVKFMILIWIIVENTQGNACGLGKWYLPAFLVALFGAIIFFVVRSHKLK